MGTNSCVPFRGRGPRSGEGVLEGKNRKETQSRAGRLSAVTSTVECHIGAWPRTPYGPSRGNEGGRQEIFASYSSRTIPAAPPLVAGATTFAPVGSVSLDSQSPKGSLRIQFPCHPASRWDYGCWAFRAAGAHGSSGRKTIQPGFAHSAENVQVSRSWPIACP